MSPEPRSKFHRTFYHDSYIEILTIIKSDEAEINEPGNNEELMAASGHVIVSRHVPLDQDSGVHPRANCRYLCLDCDFILFI